MNMPSNLDTNLYLSDTARVFLAKKTHCNFIAGEWKKSVSGETFETLDPASGDVIGILQRGSSDDIDMAVSAARLAFKEGPWADMLPMDRSKLLWAIADKLERHIDELAELETYDQGKALYVGRWGEIPGAISQFRYYSGLATKIEGSHIPTSINYQPEGKEIFAYTMREPVGVVGAIVPWNSPIVLTAMKIAPILATGCTMVLKPAENTSLTAIRMLELMVEAGLPEGVINLVTGYGHEAGAALAAHMDVNKLVFTGSTATGRAVVEAGKGNLKRVTLELGGKSPVIILPDADIEAAIEGAANAIFYNGGQVCIAGSRLYVHDSVFDRVVEGIVEKAKTIKLGHGLDPKTQMGPLVSQEHAKKVSAFIDEAKQQGAKLLCGGDLTGPNNSFVSPTVIVDVTPEMTIVKEEVFGPVLVADRFSEIDEVLEIANDSDFGLAASIWTENLSHAHKLAAKLEAGTVWINSHAMYDPSLPIGGTKQSGWGRDSGQAALDNYLELKTVCAVI